MSFSADLNRWVKKTGLSLEQAHRAIVLDLASKVALRSPVRDGHYLANHQVTVDEPASEEIDGETTNKNIVVERAEREVRASFGKTLFITNNVPYANRIEFDNWSPQSPGGVYRLAKKDTKNAISKHVNEAKKS